MNQIPITIPWEYFMLYLILINILGFVLMGIDKRRARLHLWRIAEKKLFLAAILGGSFGMRIGMEVFRHKTKHRSFTIGIPCIFLVQAVLLFLLYSMQ